MLENKLKFFSKTKKPAEQAEKEPFVLWQIINWIAVVILLLAGFFTVRFIYENVYLSLTNAYAIIVLSKDLDIEKIDAAAFEQAEKGLTRKEVAPMPDNLRYIFTYPSASTTTTAKPTNKR